MVQASTTASCCEDEFLTFGFHTCVRCLSIYGHQCTQAIKALATKACVLTHVELLRGDARLVLRYAVTEKPRITSLTLAAVLALAMAG